MNKNLRTALTVVAVVIAATVVFAVALSPLKSEEKSKDDSEIRITETTDYNKIVKRYEVVDKFTCPEFGRYSYYDPLTEKLLYYRMYLPERKDENKKSPVLLYLHDENGMGMDNERQINNLPYMVEAAGDILSEVIIVCPQTSVPWTVDMYYGDESGNLGSVKCLLDGVVNKYNGDPDRIYVIGASLGADGVWRLLERYGDYFAAAVPISSWGGADVSNITDVPIWMFHGQAAGYSSFLGAQMIYNSIKTGGGSRVRLTGLEDVGDDAWKYVYNDRDMYSWMFSQNKKTHQGLDYEYIGCFEVVSPDGEVVFSEKDVTYTISIIDGEDEYGKFTLTDDAVKRLKKAYSDHKNEVFTVKYCSQKLYTYIHVKIPKDNAFRLEMPFEENEEYCSFLDDIIYSKNLNYTKTDFD